MATWRSTTFVEVVPGSPRTSFAEDGSTSVRVYDVPWEAQAKAVEDFLGYAEVKSTGGSPPDGFYIARTTPHYHPDFFQPNQKPGLYATKITSIEGIGFQGKTTAIPSGTHPWSKPANSIKSSSDVTVYDKARMTVVYESLTYDILEDTDPGIVSATTGFPDESKLTRNITKIPSSASQYLALASGDFVWVTGLLAGSSVKFPPGKIITSWDLNFKWHGVPIEAISSQAINPSYSASTCFIDLAFGKVNATAFAGYDAGTLLLLAAPMTPHRSATLRRTYDVNFLMKWFKPGHHKIFGKTASGTAGFIEISADGSAHAINGSTPDGKHIYDVFEFSSLFKPAN